ncbi:hypothetical protein EDB85DRAFT_1892280 [Lactarius pseudohatsudake]|nr:hypothetical protein EDB85DRAFT_1892280 [Lactarius pseudohatsudake]
MASASASTCSLLSPAWGTPYAASSSARPEFGVFATLRRRPKLSSRRLPSGAQPAPRFVGSMRLFWSVMTRMPRVVEMVKTHFRNVTDILLFDVTPTLGVETLSSITTELVPRNATTPTKDLLFDGIANVVAKDKATNKDQSMTRIKHTAISSRSQSRSSGTDLIPWRRIRSLGTSPIPVRTGEVVAKGQAGDGAVTADANREKTNGTRL